MKTVRLLLPLLATLLLFAPRIEARSVGLDSIQQGEYPLFRGKGVELFQAYVNGKVKYPKSLIAEGISGVVKVSFVVDRSGRVGMVKVVHGLHAELDREAVRVVSASPQWTPAIRKGKPASVAYNIDVTFNPPAPEAPVPEPEKKVVQPKFQGGGMEDFSSYLMKQTVYPEAAVAEKIQGRVLVQFTVQADGTVSDVKVMTKVHPLLDAEALRVVKESPKWEPGTIDGTPAPIGLTVPVIFML